MLINIEPRGDHATGILKVRKGGGGVDLEKNDTPASVFIWTRRPCLEDTKTVLLHTRFATQGDPTHNENNHPVCYGTCFAVHNGMIANDGQLFKDNEDLKRNAEVDSIIIPAMVSKFGFGRIEDALEEIDGAMAVAIADPINNPDELILARGQSNPLVVLNHKKAIIWASTKTAIENSWSWFIGTPPTKGYVDVAPGEYLHIKNDRFEKRKFDCYAARWPVSNNYGYHVNRFNDKGWTQSYQQNTGRIWSYKDGIEEYEMDSCHTPWWENDAGSEDTQEMEVVMVDGQRIYVPVEDLDDDDMEAFEEIARRQAGVHRRAIMGTAHCLNVTEAFIEWILCLVPSELFEEKPSLLDRQKAVQREYLEQVKVVEMLMNDDSTSSTAIVPYQEDNDVENFIGL